MTAHAVKRMGQRKITLTEIEHVIQNGDIIEDYPGDKPFPSCLILGTIREGFPLYVVCAVSDRVHLITAHWMDPEKWLDPVTRRDRS